MSEKEQATRQFAGSYYMPADRMWHVRMVVESWQARPLFRLRLICTAIPRSCVSMSYVSTSEASMDEETYAVY